LADYQAVFAVGDALARYLNNAYDPVAMGFPCTFKLVSSAEIANEDTTKLDKTISLFLHRMTTAEHYRNVTRLQDAPLDQPILYLDLHYMLSYWDAAAEGAEAEQKILTWTMQTLQSNAILDTSVLGLSSSAPGWAVGDSVQLIPADLSLQDILDIWNALGPNYRLSVGYVVRVVRVDKTITAGMPVVATRFTMQQAGAP
jgi:hypothetical protein